MPLKNLQQGLLDQSVDDARHAELSDPAVRFGDFDPFDRLRLGISILLAAGLSFLGLGVRPPLPDWGLMLSTLRQSIYVVPLVCALPGLAIFITSICCNLVSDGLRAAMDVRM